MMILIFNQLACICGASSEMRPIDHYLDLLEKQNGSAAEWLEYTPQT